MTLPEDDAPDAGAASSLKRLSAIFHYAREGILVTDAAGRIVDANPAFTRITGYSRAEVLGQTPALLQSGRQGKEFYQAMWNTLRDCGSWEVEVWNRRRNGEVYIESLSVQAVCDADGAVRSYVGFFSDITAQKAHHDQLERIANYDALTGLPNRRLLADRLRQAVALAARTASMLAVAYLDLDGFKAVNDRFGHACGDELLIRVARRMTGAVRSCDAVARLGGDEFVVLLQNLANRDDSSRLLDRLRAACADAVGTGAMQARVSASIGVAFFPAHGHVDADVLLQRADQAMYQAKLDGKDCWRVYDDGGAAS